MNGALSIAQHIAHSTASGTAARLRQALNRLMPRAKSPTPERISHAPLGLAPGDPDRAQAMYRGQWTFAGSRQDLGIASPFSHTGADPAWRAALFSFEWLADLAVSENELSRAQARALVGDWIERYVHRRGPAWDLAVTSDRTIAMMRHAPLYLTGAGEDFQRRVLASLGRQMRHILARIPASGDPIARLKGAIALNFAIVCMAGLEKYAERATALLESELDRQILPDGGHISRNPEVLVDLLLDLVPLRHAFETTQTPAPDSLLIALDRMLPFLATLRHGDGGLALFNGAGATRRRAISSLVQAANSKALPIERCRHSGYARLAAGKTLAIVDTGAAPAMNTGAAGHAGCLSFELSHDTTRIVVNCGHCADGPGEWRRATAATAAHSTLTIGKRSSAVVLAQEWLEMFAPGPFLFGPENVGVEVGHAETGSIVNARHDGYAKRFGLIHQRQIFVARQGGDVRGEDRLLPAPDQAASGKVHDVAVRFHLHPAVKATLSQDGLSVLIMLPNRTGWRFSAKGAVSALEESVYFDDRSVPQRTQQIVLNTAVSGETSLKWAFRLLEKSATARPDRTAAPEGLPLTGGSMNP